MFTEDVSATQWRILATTGASLANQLVSLAIGICCKHHLAIRSGDQGVTDQGFYEH